MNNKKGQALVEFILILPILIFIVLAFIDISRLMIMKNHLETVLKDVDEKTTEVKDQEYKIELTKKEEGEEVFLELKSCLEVVTPGLNKVLGDPACVKTSKTIKVEAKTNLETKEIE